MAMDRMTKNLVGAIAAAVLLLGGCASAPTTRADQRSLVAQADAAIDSLVRKDPSLRGVLNQAAGYAVFPRVREGAFVVGATGGTGVVYEGGEPVGFATLTGGSIGAQVGGQSFTELIVFDTREALQRLQAGNFDLTANASLTAVTEGAAAEARAEGGTRVFIHDESGLMAAASVGAQSFGYEPMT